MVDPSNDEDLDALLGGGRLSGPARDRIFDKVAAEVAPQPRSRTRPGVWAFALAAAGAAAAVLIVAPRLTTRMQGGLRAKGDDGPGPAALQLDVACIGGTLSACPQGATLMFGASGAPSAGLLSAYAEPLEPGLERIWYFSADGESPRLSTSGGTEVVQRAVRVGPEHAPGHYRLHVFLTRAPASRAALLAGSAVNAIGSREIDLGVVGAGSP
jgi:hypothetical protein